MLEQTGQDVVWLWQFRVHRGKVRGVLDFFFSSVVIFWRAAFVSANSRFSFLALGRRLNGNLIINLKKIKPEAKMCYSVTLLKNHSLDEL